MSEEVIKALSGVRFCGSSEDELQAGLAEILDAAGIEHKREVPLTGRDRIDFLTADGVGIEVKVKGGLQELTRQIHRYAQSERVTAIVVVSTKLQHARLPAELNGKPVASVHVGGFL